MIDNDKLRLMSNLDIAFLCNETLTWTDRNVYEIGHSFTCSYIFAPLTLRIQNLQVIALAQFTLTDKSPVSMKRHVRNLHMKMLGIIGLMKWYFILVVT